MFCGRKNHFSQMVWQSQKFYNTINSSTISQSLLFVLLRRSICDMRSFSPPQNIPRLWWLDWCVHTKLEWTWTDLQPGERVDQEWQIEAEVWSIYSDTGVYFFSVCLDGWGQGRTASASTSVYEFNRVVRGHHVCKPVWILTNEMLQGRYWTR